MVERDERLLAVPVWLRVGAMVLAVVFALAQVATDSGVFAWWDTLVVRVLRTWVPFLSALMTVATWLLGLLALVLLLGSFARRAGAGAAGAADRGAPVDESGPEYAEDYVFPKDDGAAPAGMSESRAQVHAGWVTMLVVGGVLALVGALVLHAGAGPDVVTRVELRAGTELPERGVQVTLRGRAMRDGAVAVNPVSTRHRSEQRRNIWFVPMTGLDEWSRDASARVVVRTHGGRRGQWSAPESYNGRLAGPVPTSVRRAVERSGVAVAPEARLLRTDRTAGALRTQGWIYGLLALVFVGGAVVEGVRVRRRRD